jgi:hypothetical protein
LALLFPDKSGFMSQVGGGAAFYDMASSMFPLARMRYIGSLAGRIVAFKMVNGL